MSIKLVLAEKPSVGKDLAKVLGANKSANGYMSGNNYIVTWAFGHLVTLASPETYDEKYKNWDTKDLPMLPKDMKLSVIKKTGKQFNVIKSLMQKSEVSEIIIATDAGREGEVVARWIIEKAHIKKPIKRLWISSQTDKAIKDGFKNLKPGRDYENLYKSGFCRATADWYVGLNATRALTCKYNAQLSAGRVQTPTLAMIVKREDEIQNFKPKEYYIVDVMSNNFSLRYVNQNNQTRIFDKDVAQKTCDFITNKSAKVVNVDKKMKKVYAPALYDLTELQRDANKIWGYSAKETLSIMQRLYENHKVLTYPRTDSRYLTSDIQSTLSDRLKAINVSDYSRFVSNIQRLNLKINKSCINDKKVSDHHAIIPTEQRVFISDLSTQERNIYDLVVKRFLASFYPPFEYEDIKVKAMCDDKCLVASGKVVKSKGFKSVYNDEFDDDMVDDEMMDQILPDTKVGDTLKLSLAKIKTSHTKPPARYNEASLLSAMENPQRFMDIDNKELVKTMQDAGGLGTVATRADIIEKLYASFYIEKKGKEIIPTSKGKQIINLVPDDLKSPMLTAKWEKDLVHISCGKLSDKKFIEDIKIYTKELVNDIKNKEDAYKHDNMTKEKCPDCGKYLLSVNGKKGKMLVCQDRDCGYRKSVSVVTNSRCPNCHNKLEIRSDMFVCPKCSHREKKEAFTKRKQESKNKANKKDVANYMKKQNAQNNTANNAMALALEKWKNNNK